MKSVQPVVIIPFGFVLLVYFVGYLFFAAAAELAVEAVGYILSAAFVLLKWLFFGLCYCGGMTFILIGIYKVIQTLRNRRYLSTPYLVWVAVGLFSFSYGFDWAYSDKFQKIVSTQQYLVTTAKWFF